MLSVRHWPVVFILGVAVPIGLRSQSPSRPRPTRCFIPTYWDAHGLDSLSYAASFSLQADTNCGNVESAGFFADTSNFWRMFLSRARWVQHADRLQLQFTNGFTFVTYEMRMQGDSLIGQASVSFDFKVEGRPDPVIRVVARPVSCPPRRR